MKRSPVGVERRLRAFAAHCSPQAFGLAGGEAGERHRHLDHLVLEDDRAERVGEDRLEAGVLVGDLVGGILAEELAALQIGVDSAALDRAGAHQRHLDDHIVDRLRKAARQHLHLRPALDLKDAGGLGGADRLEGLRVVERDPREIDSLVAGLGDLLDRAFDRGEHSQAEQIDLQEAGVGARVLVPLDDLPALHRRGLHRAEIDQRPGREHHPARVLGDVAGQPPGLAGEPGETAPARRSGASWTDCFDDVALDLLRAARVHVGDPGNPLDLAWGQAQGLAEITDRAARAIAGDG